MVGDLNLLTATAFSAGVVHTILGPDHYVPFVALSRSGGWGLGRTLLLTTCCGLGHVLSSVVVGAVGIALGTAVMTVEAFESLRGETAGWLLLAAGIAYLVWGIKKAMRHGHSHDEVAPVGADGGRPQAGVMPWVLFLIFVFGPCEVLVPLLMYPAANANPGMMVSVVAAFTVGTLGAMIAAVLISLYGIRWLDRLGFTESLGMHRYSHAFAGAAVTACGALVKIGF